MSAKLLRRIVVLAALLGVIGGAIFTMSSTDMEFEWGKQIHSTVFTP